MTPSVTCESCQEGYIRKGSECLSCRDVCRGNSDHCVDRAENSPFVPLPRRFLPQSCHTLTVHRATSHVLESEYSLSKCSAERVAPREASADVLQLVSPLSLCISLTLLRNQAMDFRAAASYLRVIKQGLGYDCTCEVARCTVSV
eukprot:sb/3473933/